MSLRDRLSLVLALVVLVPATAALRLRAMEHHVAGATYEDVYYLPPPEWLPTLSLGHEEALADLIWMRGLVYFGDEMLARGGLVHVFDYTEAMLTLDPDFRAVYHWIGTAGVYRPQAPSPDEIERAVAIMRRGLERFPEDGELAWAIGATLAFELPPLLEPGSAREEARAEGAEYLGMAARLGAAPEWAVLSNATILARVGRAEAAVQHLQEMYQQISDENVRAEIRAAIASLRSEAYSAAFSEAAEDEELRRTRELPYVPPDLYTILGPRPVVDWRGAFRGGVARTAIDAELPDLEELDTP